ncbi:MAG TPA: DinB family protein [Bacteroidia bacterium]|nr:DinB family protein [Bacteroidia bacterium]
MITRPAAGTYDAYYQSYIDEVKSDPILILESQVLDFKAFMSEIPAEKEEYRYAANKWSVKEVIGHIIDTERIMTCRALCIARGEKLPLPAFEEDDYVKVANFNRRTLYDLGHEFGAVRSATLALFKSLTASDLDRSGIANNNKVTARAILYVIAGHHAHHENVLRERYLQEISS